MDSLTLRAAIALTRQIEWDVMELHRLIELERLRTGDRQYLSRCFDLLTMELLALREFMARMTNESPSS